jgi:chromate reductase, NAD(P)H dehydrogenase (quinone)
MKFLLIAGSSRQGSLNAMLQHRIAAVAEQHGHTCHLYPATDLDAPIYQGDYEKEHGVPANIQMLITAIQEANKIVMVTPEYNGSLPPLLKNAIDWCTRVEHNPWQGRTVLLAGASPGRLGAMRALTQLSTVMSTVQSWVAPMYLSCPHANAEGIAELDADMIERFLHQGDR